MDCHQYVRAHLPPLAIAREPEIVDELAQHLSDLYAEARDAGLNHEAALARASAALPEYPEDLAREIESASRALPGLIVDRWRPPSRNLRSIHRGEDSCSCSATFVVTSDTRSACWRARRE